MIPLDFVALAAVVAVNHEAALVGGAHFFLDLARTLGRGGAADQLEVVANSLAALAQQGDGITLPLHVLVGIVRFLDVAHPGAGGLHIGRAV